MNFLRKWATSAPCNIHKSGGWEPAQPAIFNFATTPLGKPRPCGEILAHPIASTLWSHLTMVRMPLDQPGLSSNPISESAPSAFPRPKLSCLLQFRKSFPRRCLGRSPSTQVKGQLFRFEARTETTGSHRVSCLSEYTSVHTQTNANERGPVIYQVQ